MFICGMVLRCAGISNRLESGPVTADLTTTVVHSYTVDLTTTVVHSYKLLINDVKPAHSLTHSLTHLEYIKTSTQHRESYYIVISWKYIVTMYLAET